MRTCVLVLILLIIPMLALGQLAIAPVSDGMLFSSSCLAMTVLSSEATVQSRYVTHGSEISIARAFYIFDLNDIPETEQAAVLRLVGAGSGSHECYAFTSDSPVISSNWFEFSIEHPTCKIGFINDIDMLHEMFLDITDALSWVRIQGSRYFGIRISCPLTPQYLGQDLWFYTSESSPDNRPRIIIDEAVTEDSHTLGEVKSMFR